MTEDDYLHNEIIQWGSNYLSSHGYTLKSKLPENVKSTPWSYVVRFATSDGYIYLKHTPKLLALEASIIKILRDQFKLSVAEIIAHNAELNCFLMKDAGRLLREILKNKFDAALVCKVIDQFTSLQLTVAGHVNTFIDVGVPDWRLDQLPILYKQLLLEKDLLIADGLSEIEISKLKMLHPKVSNLCKNLSAYPIKETIVQPDFNNNNILISDTSKNITIIDLGEIAISHPFFSLLNFLQQIKKHHALTDNDDAYLKIKDACFKNYRSFESDTSAVFETAHLLSLIYGALCGYRLQIACDQVRFTSSFQRHGRPSVSLKEFMTAFNCTSQ